MELGMWAVEPAVAQQGAKQSVLLLKTFVSNHRNRQRNLQINIALQHP